MVHFRLEVTISPSFHIDVLEYGAGTWSGGAYRDQDGAPWQTEKHDQSGLIFAYPR